MIALACPDCPPARAARAMFTDLDLARNVVVALAPFIVTFALVALIVRIVTARSRRGATGAAE